MRDRLPALLRYTESIRHAQKHTGTNPFIYSHGLALWH